MEVSKIREIASKIKYIYIIVYLVCFSFFNNAYINLFLYDQTQLLYQGLVLFGIVLLAFDFFTFAVMFKTKYSLFLVLFYVACMLSVIFNFKYGIVSNIKVIAWMLIQTFVFAAVDRSVPREHHRKYFRYASELVALVWFIFVIWSLGMFIAGTHIYIKNPATTYGYTRIGFVEGRLFGVFTDPNYASVCILFTMLMTACNMFLSKEHIAFRVYHIIMLIADYLYVLLSRSRMAELCFIAVLCMVAFFVSKRLLEKHSFPVIAKSVVMVAAAISVGCFVYIANFSINYAADEAYIAINTKEDMTEEEKQEIEDGTHRIDVEENDDITNLRSAIWSDYFKVFGDNMLFGTGPRNGLEYAKEHMPDSFIVKKDYQYHNGYLAVLVGTGILGFAAVMIYIVLVAKKVVVYLWKSSKEQGQDYIPILMLCSVLVIGAISAISLHILFFNNSVCDAIFWFVLGYVLYMVCEKEPESRGIIVRLTDVLRPRKFKN